MSPEEKRDRNSAAITRFVILLVIVGVSHLGVSYGKDGRQAPERKTPATQTAPTTSRILPTQESKPQPSIKAQLREETDRPPRIPSSKEPDSVETESYDPDRALQKIDAEIENASSSKSIRQPTNVQTVPGRIKDVIIEPPYSTPVQATR